MINGSVRPCPIIMQDVAWLPGHDRGGAVILLARAMARALPAQRPEVGLCLLHLLCWSDREVPAVRRLAVRVAPLLLGLVFVVAGLLLGPSQVVLGLVVIAPLLAASIVGWRLTAAYGLGAVLTAVALGFFNDQYTSQAWAAQGVRIAGVVAGSVLAVAACSTRLRRERRMRELSVASAEAQAQAQVAEGMARLAEVLQRSLLTEPPELDDLEIAARYVPGCRARQDRRRLVRRICDR
jgi:hypothetical protein